MTEKEEWQNFLTYFCNQYLEGLNDYQALIKNMYYKLGYNKIITEDKSLDLSESFPNKISNVKAKMFKHIAGKDCIKIKYESECNILIGTKKGKSKKLLEILLAEFEEWKTSQVINEPTQTRNEQTKIIKVYETLSNILEELLRQLNYNDQICAFKKQIDTKQRTGIFIIHGQSKDYGQKWLLNLLLHVDKKIVPGSDKIEYPITMSLRNNEFHSFLCRIDQCFSDQSQNQQDTNQIIDHIRDSIYQFWQQGKNIILIIHNISWILKDEKNEKNDCLRDFLKQCWIPIVNEIEQQNKIEQQQNNYNHRNNRVLLFLVDYDNSLNKLTELQRQFDNQFYILPDINNFDEYLISNWFDNYVQDKMKEVNDKMKEVNKEVKKEDFIKIKADFIEIVKKNPQPISFFQRICEYFDLQWSDIELTLKL